MALSPAQTIRSRRVIALEPATPWLNDRDALAAHGERLGYLYLPKLIDPGVLTTICTLFIDHGRATGWLSAASGDDQIRSTTGATLSGAGYDDPEWIALQVALAGALVELRGQAAFADVTRTLFGEEANKALGSVARISLPADHAHITVAHQEAAFVNAGPRLWVIWIPLVRTGPESGALGVIPGSHHAGFRPHPDTTTGEHGCDVAPDEVWAVGTFEPGDVMMFHGLTVHGAWPNSTPDTPRLSVDFRVQPTSDPFPFSTRG